MWVKIGRRWQCEGGEKNLRGNKSWEKKERKREMPRSMGTTILPTGFFRWLAFPSHPNLPLCRYFSRLYSRVGTAVVVPVHTVREV